MISMNLLIMFGKKYLWCKGVIFECKTFFGIQAYHMILYWKHSVGSTCSFQIAAIDLLKKCSVQIGCINLIFSRPTDEEGHFRIWTCYFESGAGTQTILLLKTPSKKTLVLLTGYNTGKRLILYAFLYRSMTDL